VWRPGGVELRPRGVELCPGGVAPCPGALELRPFDACDGDDPCVGEAALDRVDGLPATFWWTAVARLCTRATRWPALVCAAVVCRAERE